MIGVSLSGNYAYVACYDKGFLIFDISNPSSPVLKGSYDTAGEVYDVSISSNYAYVPDTWNGLLIFDISNPSSPVLKGSYNNGYTFDVSVSGNYAYIANSDGLNIVDISNPSSPILKCKTTAAAYDVTVSDNYVYLAAQENGLIILKTDIQNQMPTEGPLVQIQGHPEVYLIKDGTKHHFTSPEALLWNGHNFSDVTNVTSETLQSYLDGQDISISQAIIDKYNVLGKEPIFGAPDGKGELKGENDSAGVYCSYVNFEKGAIECFANGPEKNVGKAYAIFNPLLTKWTSLGYGKSVLGYPIDNMSEEQISKFGTKFRYQNFANGTESGA